MIHCDAPTCRECGSMVMTRCSNCGGKYSHDADMADAEDRGYERGRREALEEAASLMELMHGRPAREAIAIRALAKEPG